MKLLVINGPNLNLLGRREPAIYGSQSLKDLEQQITDYCMPLGILPCFFQSNHEGAIIDRIHQASNQEDAILINPAAYTHTSIAIHDALKAVGLPAVEVHLSDLTRREAFRQVSYVAPACIASIMGKGFAGYLEGIALLKSSLESAEGHA